MISILTPSRSRPDRAKRMLDSAFKAPGCEIDIKFFLNEDDPMLSDYFEFLTPDQYVIGPNQSTCYSWNLMAETARYDIVFLVGDDAQFACDNWGKIILNTFDQYPDKIVCVYPRSPSIGKKKNPHFCLHKNWINTVGYFLPPSFYHWYVDKWIREVAIDVGRYHLLPEFEMIIEEKLRDDVKKAYCRSWMRQRDDWNWDKTKHHRNADVALLKDFINNFK